MKMRRRNSQRSDVLRYSPRRISQATVARHYKNWRKDQGIPVRCDNPVCRFHAEPLVWNGKLLPLILDHLDGNRLDNRPEMLRYLCPNCDSQLETRGGGNKGRIRDPSEGAFTIVGRDGRRKHELFHTERVEATDVADAELIKAPNGKSVCGPTMR
jgi:hypothetical protein